jgi:hypothetical protein
VLNKYLILIAGLVSASGVLAVDERALKSVQPHQPATVLAPANVVSYSGDNSTGPEWARPFSDGTCCSAIGPVRYHVQEFSLSANDSCDINSVQTGYDGYIFIYTSPFDAANQTVNFVAGNDDGNGGIGTSDIMGLALTGGTTYTFVSTAFELGEVGPFTNTITCPTATVTLGGAQAGPARSIPTLGQSALGLLVLLVAAVAVVIGHRARAA